MYCIRYLSTYNQIEYFLLYAPAANFALPESMKTMRSFNSVGDTIRNLNKQVNTSLLMDLKNSAFNVVSVFLKSFLWSLPSSAITFIETVTGILISTVNDINISQKVFELVLLVTLHMNGWKDTQKRWNDRSQAQFCFIRETQK